MLAKIGDIVKAKGISVEIAEINYQEWYKEEGWNIEFMDTNDNYRSWKQQFDGGELIKK